MGSRRKRREKAKEKYAIVLRRRQRQRRWRQWLQPQHGNICDSSSSSNSTTHRIVNSTRPKNYYSNYYTPFVYFHRCVWVKQNTEWIKWIRKNVKNMFFSALHSAVAAAEAVLQTIKICGIERALEYFTLPHRIRLHTWLACSVLFAVCIHDRRRDRCICVGQTFVFVCAHTALTTIIDVLRLLLLLLIRFFNEICMAFCMAVLWCYLDKTVNKRCCCWIAVLVACALARSFFRLFVYSFDTWWLCLVAGLHAHRTKGMFVLRLID